MKDPQLSIIIPTYNIAANWHTFFIKKQEKLVQELPIEIIIIDDNSKDDTLGLLQTLQGNVKIWRNLENRGPNFSRNLGIHNSSTNYLLFLDSDDEIDIGILKNILENEEYKDFDIQSFSFQFKSNSGIFKKFIYKQKRLNGKTLFRQYLKGSFNSVSWGRIYKRSFLISNKIKFIEDKVHGRDILFCANAFKNSKAANFSSKILVTSHIRAESFSREYSLRNLESAITIIKDLFPLIEKDDLLYYNIFSFRTILYHYLISSLRLKNDKWNEGVIMLCRAHPFLNNLFLIKVFCSKPSKFLAKKCCQYLKYNY